MKELLIVGQPNVGKTLFTLNFAAYLGAKDVSITFQDTRSTYTKQFTIHAAKEMLVSAREHHTQSLQMVTITFRKGKGKRTCRFIDSVGLVEHIHPDRGIREAMGLTLGLIPKTAHFFHIVDASNPGNLRPLDFQLAQLGELASSYALIANKWDFVKDSCQLQQLRQIFPNKQIFAVSALQQTGFKEVKAYVRSLF